MIRSGIDRALVAKVGTVVFAWALGAPLALPSATAQHADVHIASAMSEVAMPVARGGAVAAVLVSGVPESIRDLLDVPTLPTRTAVLGSVRSSSGGPSAATTSTAPTRPDVPPEALVRDGVVIASWYGPGFYGNRTACGQIYTPEIIGVAHRILRCGTLITITSPRGVTVTVPVIDRGPYIAGRALDLSNATRLALQCSDLCRVRMVVQ